MLQTKFFDSVIVTSVDYDQLLKKLGNAACLIRDERSSVKRALLFGSFAKGDYTPHSDTDILIVLDKTDKHFLERRDDFIGYFKDIPFDVNILVYTEDEIERMIADNNQFIKEALADSCEIGNIP